MTEREADVRMPLVHDGLTIAVSARRDDLAWLTEFLGPAYAAANAGTGAADIEVSLTDDDVSVADGAGDDTVVGFAFDSGPVVLRGRAGPGVARYASQLGHAAFEVAADGRRTAIRCGEETLAGRFNLMRVAREYAHNYSVRRGGLMVHAAAVAVDDAAVLMIGPKGSGKTTLLLRLLTAGGASYMSNDRVLMPEGSDAVALAVPTVIGLRPGTRRLFPRLTERLAAAGDFRRYAAERSAIGFEGPETWGGTWHHSGAQVCEAVGCEALGTAPVGAIIVLGGEDAAAPVRRLNRDEAAAVLGGSLVGIGGGRLWSDLFTRPEWEAPDPGEIVAKCERVAALVPCLACTSRVDLDQLSDELRGAVA